ncbi:hypothetical protein CCYA_CCYA12G3424 [Cyanidiococcus yangmingshanensis]|nr:hypothetical protein CCYA_CCYA12G3424 [Cyanidiococcus yangmingshanensis]
MVFLQLGAYWNLHSNKLKTQRGFMFVLLWCKRLRQCRSPVRNLPLAGASPAFSTFPAGVWTRRSTCCSVRPRLRPPCRCWRTRCAADSSGTSSSPTGPDDEDANELASGPLVLRLQRCRRCGELFDARLNHKRACRFHGHALGDRGYYRLFMVPREEAEASLSWPEHGRDTGSASPWVLQSRWSCCGAAYPDSLGCRLDRHLSWDEELRPCEGLLSDAQMAAWKLRTHWC